MNILNINLRRYCVSPFSCIKYSYNLSNTFPSKLKHYLFFFHLVLQLFFSICIIQTPPNALLYKLQKYTIILYRYTISIKS